MHLVIGTDKFLGRGVATALRADVPVIELGSDADEQTLREVVAGVEVVVFCGQGWAPDRRLRYRKRIPELTERVVEAAIAARIRRLVHVSTADVFGSEQPAARITEKAIPKPTHAYEKLRLFEEEWVLEAAGDELEVVVVRPARVFGEGEEWILPRLLSAAVHGRLWMPNGGQSRQTFVHVEDVGRACLAASDRGRPGHRYLVGGFDGSWAELVLSSARAVGFAADIGSLPYDLFFLRALAAETFSAPGAPVWPGIYAVDVLGRRRSYDDSHSRRELTWSPSVGSFEQEMPAMARWLSQLPDVASALVEPQENAEVTSPPGR
ncbi:MAG TPA: NAD-dependent epimerase/dehydratase family protein [Candidatus Dormibacteraeota bacterium]